MQFLVVCEQYFFQCGDLDWNVGRVLDMPATISGCFRSFTFKTGAKSAILIFKDKNSAAIPAVNIFLELSLPNRHLLK